MKIARYQAINQIKNGFLLSLNRYLYVLSQSEGQGFNITKSFEFEGNVHYVALKTRSLIGITNESDKLLKFYDLEKITGADKAADIGSIEP